MGTILAITLGDRGKLGGAAEREEGGGPWRRGNANPSAPSILTLILAMN